MTHDEKQELLYLMRRMDFWVTSPIKIISIIYVLGMSIFLLIWSISLF